MITSSSIIKLIRKSTIQRNRFFSVLQSTRNTQTHQIQKTIQCERDRFIKFDRRNNFILQSHIEHNVIVRNVSKYSSKESKHKTSVIFYVCAAGIFMLGMSYAGVPLYRMFCQATGLGGQAVQDQNVAKVENMTAVKGRVLKIKFNADVASSMRWNFKPLQSEVKVLPGETALAFYTAKNPSDKPVIGISTYNIVPFEAGQYFNKIQCFCFEEQRLNPHEQVDMPVFFYIDPEYAEDPKLEHEDTIILSYTFFEAKDGLQLPMPSFMAS